MYFYLVYYQFIRPYLAADIWPQHHSATISCFLYYSYPLTGPHPAWHSVSVGRVCVTLLTICALSTFALSNAQGSHWGWEKQKDGAWMGGVLWHKDQTITSHNRHSSHWLGFHLSSVLLSLIDEILFLSHLPGWLTQLWIRKKCFQLSFYCATQIKPFIVEFLIAVITKTSVLFWHEPESFVSPITLMWVAVKRVDHFWWRRCSLQLVMDSQLSLF